MPKPVRILIISLCLALLLGVAHVHNTHKHINETLEVARKQLGSYPFQSYRTFNDIFEYSNVVALGRVDRALDIYSAELVEGALRQGQVRPANEAAYQVGFQTVLILYRLGELSGRDFDADIRRVMESMLDGVDSIREEGTLQAWVAMMGAFGALADRDLIPPGIFTDFDGWFQTMNSVSPRAMALRDATATALSNLSVALSIGGLEFHRGEGPFALPVATAMSDMNHIRANIALRQAHDVLQQCRQYLQEPNMPRSLRGLQAVLAYNQAALKISHLVTLGGAARQMGSAFIAHVTIRKDANQVPTQYVMYQTYCESIEADLRLAEQALDQAHDLGPEAREILHGLIGHARSNLPLNDTANLLTSPVSQMTPSPAGGSVRFMEVARQAAASPQPLLMLRYE